MGRDGRMTLMNQLLWLGKWIQKFLASICDPISDSTTSTPQAQMSHRGTSGHHTGSYGPFGLHGPNICEYEPIQACVNTNETICAHTFPGPYG